MDLLFVILVLAGFIFHFLSTWSVAYADRLAWGCWLAAAILWAVLRL